jgi:hypothetical protein
VEVAPFDVPPDAVHHLLTGMKDADAATFDALVTKVKEIDPHFFDRASGGGKQEKAGP